MIVTSIRQIRLYYKGCDQHAYELFDTERLADDENHLRRFVFLLGAERVVPAASLCHLATREVESGNALTYAAGVNATSIYANSLYWASQYISHNVSSSDGPRIVRWPFTMRAWAWGQEQFTSRTTGLPCLMIVESDAGLKEIRLYSGKDLYRRFVLAGDKRFEQPLFLDGTVQQDIVMIAEDVKGGKAVSWALRTWKDANGITFCGDHVNDGLMRMTHGPHHLAMGRVPGLPIDICGGSWDGGPAGVLPLASTETAPKLVTDRGIEEGGRTNQTTILEFTDEGALAVASDHYEVFDPSLKRVLNAWNTRGPLGGPTRLMDYIQRVQEWEPPTLGAPSAGWAAPSVPAGVQPTIYASTLTFKGEFKIEFLRLAFLSSIARCKLRWGERARSRSRTCRAREAARCRSTRMTGSRCSRRPRPIPTCTSTAARHSASSSTTSST